MEAYLTGTKVSDPSKTAFYKAAFTKYEEKKGFDFVWSWASFFLSAWHLLYRKCYVEGVILLVGVSIVSGILESIPNIGWLLVIGMWVFMGFLNNFVIYKRYTKQLNLCRQQNLEHTDTIARLRGVGGTNLIAAVVPAIISLLVFVIIFVALGAAIFAIGSSYY